MYMSIKTCIYELIRIELSCGDMREIIFSQDFLQYMMCQATVFYSSEYRVLYNTEVNFADVKQDILRIL